MASGNITQWQLAAWALGCLGSVAPMVWIARRLERDAKPNWVAAGAAAFMVAVVLAEPAMGLALEHLGFDARKTWHAAALPAVGEETTRAVFLWSLVRRDCRVGVWFGAGYGATENLWLALQAVAALLLMHSPLAPPAMEDHALASSSLVNGWVGVAFGCIERVVAAFLQLSFSLIIAAGLVRRRLWPIALAMLAHFAVDDASLALRQATASMGALALIAGALLAAALVAGAARMTPLLQGQRAADEPA